ncbi:sensor histidine kinase [Clostridium brassicae]|uniref:histidine kinase n=1 Tax=Clostridium brassicae TaxID=2999072 RepID=A0ABT4DD34_9CLOT|nr:ATP-binding protein [Clostridium brassicae]MCY6959056.1 ATP-binding protein [Clostridium brassicae]
MNKKTKFIKIFRVILRYSYILIKQTIMITPRIIKTLERVITALLNKFKIRLKFSITFKLNFIYTLVLSILLFLFSLTILFGFKFFLIEEAKSNINMYGEIALDNIKSVSAVPNELIESISKKGNVSINILKNNKNVIYETDKNNGEYYEDFQIDSPYLVKGTDNVEILILNKNFNLNNETYYIQIISNLKKENKYFSVFWVVLVFLNIVIVIITTRFGSRISQKVIEPINEMTHTVKDINVQNLDTRLNVKGSHDELRELAQTVNDMFDRIQDSYEKQNRFVSDASHELRTPIAVIQGYANMLHRWGKDDKEVLEESITAIKDESENMKELVEKLLFLARVDKKTQEIHKEEFYINELLEEVVKETKLIDLKHSVYNKTNKKILIFADYKLMKQALRIFIDNSLKFTPENGKITVGAHINKNKVVIVVEDTGGGIPNEDIPYIFDRFYRVDKSRTKSEGGTGLGLAIAKWIISQHEGSIEVKSTLNVGTKISIFIGMKK